MEKGDLIICIEPCHGYTEGNKVAQAIRVGEIFVVRETREVGPTITQPSVLLEGVYNPINVYTGGEFCYRQKYFKRYVNIAFKEHIAKKLQHN